MFKDRWLKVEMERVQTKWDLTGSGVGYANNETGAALNNFLTDSEIAEQPNVVFLDEFEKTKAEVRQALLNVWDKGEWLSNRDHQKYPCSNTIWIVATNAVDDVIQGYFKANPGAGALENLDRTKSELSAVCSKHLRDMWTAPVAGRIHCIVPFLPFSEPEQKVLAESMLLDHIKVYAHPPNSKRKVGDLKVHYQNSVVSHIANAYSKHTGAREITKVLKRDVDTEICARWADHGMKELWISTVLRGELRTLNFSLSPPPPEEVESDKPVVAPVSAPVAVPVPTPAPPSVPDIDLS